MEAITKNSLSSAGEFVDSLTQDNELMSSSASSIAKKLTEFLG
jgi:hypothetical protein